MNSLRLPIIALVAVVFTSLLFLMSCGRSESSRELEEIRLYMDSHADSRIDDLLAIDPATLDGESDRMLYEVLLTQALDKAHESLASRDSVMQVAADWFSARSDTRKAFLATYFLGRVKYEKEEYPQALAAMFKAHDLAKELDDKFWIGMSARGISDIYNESYNPSDGLIYAKIEFDNIELSGRQPYINYALMDLSRVYFTNAQYDSVHIKLNQVRDSVLKYDDLYLNFLYKELLAKTFIMENKDQDGLDLLCELSSNPNFTVEDSVLLGLSYLDVGDIRNSKLIMDKLDNSDDKHIHWLRYKVNKVLGNYETALENKEKDDNLQTMGIIERFKSDLSSMAVDYYNLKEHNRAKELKDARIILLLVISTFLLLTILVSFIAYRYYHSSQERIERNVLLAQNLREMLYEKETENDKIQIQLREKLKCEFSIIDKLCNKLYECEDSAVARKRISGEVVEVIEELSKNKKIDELEKSVNAVCGNIINDFKVDFPNLKDADYRLFLYSILGFSTSSITVFLGEKNITSVYERKRRLKDKIKKLDNINRERYLECL